MKAFKCDRCNRFFEKTSKNKQDTGDGLFFAKNNGTGTNYFYDLCDDCFTEMNNYWWLSSIPKEIKNESNVTMDEVYKK